MRRIAYLLVAARLLSGCGVLAKEDLKPTVPTLTHGRFVYLANRTCKRDIRHARRAFRRKPRNHETYDRDLQALLKGYNHAIFGLRGLAPPSSEAAAYRRLLASFNLEDLLGQHLLQAGDLGQAEKVKTIVRKLNRVDRRLKARAARLGLRVCAKE